MAALRNVALLAVYARTPPSPALLEPSAPSILPVRFCSSSCQRHSVSQAQHRHLLHQSPVGRVYAEALEKCYDEDVVNSEAERTLVRKIDGLIIPWCVLVLISSLH
ncbi:hypothetical protein K435DRAFT_303121 [Dendrothele bispora CBS 962.96]|uniref:Uncharacterized protein n=1 Tax=Dendrothele bispora (strain CBS 962.96) TaxID=1314807 RepID=A0A4S8LII4_DENBC|nr:hypothetical protein K435DRAFT_303121 [Dendrothele bispora CBS 962.96]